MRKGFTLVELSIVLVIIGLIIGGILAVQSMTSTAKIQGQVRQIQQFDAAISNFMTKYNALPGDFGPMGCYATGGGRCGSKLIEDHEMILNGQPSAGAWSYEIPLVWPNLGDSGFMSGIAKFTSTIPASGFDITSPVRNSPQAAIDSKTGVIIGTAEHIHRIM